MTTDNTEVVNSDQPQPEGVNKPDASQDEKTVPYARFKEIIEERNRLRDAQQAREADEKKRQEQKLMEEQKYKELLSQRETELDQLRKENEAVQEKAKAYEAEQVKLRESALAKIKDEDMRNIASKLPTTADILAFTEKLETPQSPFAAKGKPKEATNPLKALPGEDFRAYERRIQQMRSR